MITSKRLMKDAVLKYEPVMMPKLLRSLNLLFADWANRGLNQWTIKQRTQALTASTNSYNLGTDVIDVLSVVCRRNNSDLSVERLSRNDYFIIPSKTTEGRPSQFFLIVK